MLLPLLSILVQLGATNVSAEAGHALATILIASSTKAELISISDHAQERNPIPNRGIRTILSQDGDLVVPVCRTGFLVVDATSRGAYLLDANARALRRWEFGLPEPEVGGYWPTDALLIGNRIFLSHNYGLLAADGSVLKRERSLPVSFSIRASGTRKDGAPPADDFTVGWRMHLAGYWGGRLWAYGDTYVSGLSQDLTPIFTSAIESGSVLAVLPEIDGGCNALIISVPSGSASKLYCVRLNRAGKPVVRRQYRGTIGPVDWAKPIQGSEGSTVLLGCRGRCFLVTWHPVSKGLSLREIPRMGEALDACGDKVLFCQGRSSQAKLRLLDLRAMKVIHSSSILLPPGYAVKGGLLR